MFHAPVCLGPVMGILISKVKNGWVTVVILEGSFCLISKHWAGLAWLGLVFMTSDPVGENCTQDPPWSCHRWWATQQHITNSVSLHHSHSTTQNSTSTNLSNAVLTSPDTDTDCQRNEICHELLSWEFLTEKKRLSQGGQSRGRDKKGFLFLN